MNEITLQIANRLTHRITMLKDQQQYLEQRFSDIYDRDWIPVSMKLKHLKELGTSLEEFIKVLQHELDLL